MPNGVSGWRRTPPRDTTHTPQKPARQERAGEALAVNMSHRSLPVGSKPLTGSAQHSPKPRPKRGQTPGDQAAAPRPPDRRSITRGPNPGHV